VLGRYARHRDRLRNRGITLGRARLAMDSPSCVLAGLCMTGCPYGLVYSASHSLDVLRRDDRVTYHGGLLAVSVEEAGEQSTVVAREMDTGRVQRFTADRVLLACGAIGTSRLVMGALELYDTPARVQESVQFMLPFASAAPTPDPRTTKDFTLNQFNMALDLDAEGHDVSQLHFYTYNPTFLDALPRLLHRRRFGPMRTQMLRRLSVALGYLPSWASPDFQMRVIPGEHADNLPVASFDAVSAHPRHNKMLRDVLGRITAAAPLLDLWPALPMLRMSAAGKSYHWGGTFPHSERPDGRFSSDTFGRVNPWKRTHLVDAAVFPTVPATTFTLTIMANAHRIAHSSLAELD
jgi:hypothetical protein